MTKASTAARGAVDRCQFQVALSSARRASSSDERREAGGEPLRDRAIQVPGRRQRADARRGCETLGDRNALEPAQRLAEGLPKIGNLMVGPVVHADAKPNDAGSRGSRRSPTAAGKASPLDPGMALSDLSAAEAQHRSGIGRHFPCRGLYLRPGACAAPRRRARLGAEPGAACQQARPREVVGVRDDQNGRDAEFVEDRARKGDVHGGVRRSGLGENAVRRDTFGLKKPSHDLCLRRRMAARAATGHDRAGRAVQPQLRRMPRSPDQGRRGAAARPDRRAKDEDRAIRSRGGGLLRLGQIRLQIVTRLHARPFSTDACAPPTRCVYPPGHFPGASP